MRVAEISKEYVDSTGGPRPKRTRRQEPRPRNGPRRERGPQSDDPDWAWDDEFAESTEDDDDARGDDARGDDARGDDVRGDDASSDVEMQDEEEEEEEEEVEVEEDEDEDEEEDVHILLLILILILLDLDLLLLLLLLLILHLHIAACVVTTHVVTTRVVTTRVVTTRVVVVLSRLSKLIIPRPVGVIRLRAPLPPRAIARSRLLTARSLWSGPPGAVDVLLGDLGHSHAVALLGGLPEPSLQICQRALHLRAERVVGRW